jgi:hypothetical protein
MNDPAMLGQVHYKRHESDAYSTPAWCTQSLLNSVEIPEAWRVWEPAAGDGAIADVLSKRGLNVLSTDIRTGLDFLAIDPGESIYDGVSAVITNPPYSVADEFIKQALRLMKLRRGLVAMLLRNEFDCARKRIDLFGDCLHFSTKVVLTRRPRWIPGTTTGPRHNFAWFVWDFQQMGPPKIKWSICL